MGGIFIYKINKLSNVNSQLYVQSIELDETEFIKINELNNLFNKTETLIREYTECKKSSKELFENLNDEKSYTNVDEKLTNFLYKFKTILDTFHKITGDKSLKKIILEHPVVMLLIILRNFREHDGRLPLSYSYSTRDNYTITINNDFFFNEKNFKKGDRIKIQKLKNNTSIFEDEKINLIPYIQESFHILDNYTIHNIHLIIEPNSINKLIEYDSKLDKIEKNYFSFYDYEAYRVIGDKKIELKNNYNNVITISQCLGTYLGLLESYNPNFLEEINDIKKNPKFKISNF